MVGSQQVVGFHHQIGLLVALYGVAGHSQLTREGIILGLFLHAESVAERHRQEYRLYVVVSVRSLSDDVQSKVNLGLWITH